MVSSILQPPSSRLQSLTHSRWPVFEAICHQAPLVPTNGLSYFKPNIQDSAIDKWSASLPCCSFSQTFWLQTRPQCGQSSSRPWISTSVHQSQLHAVEDAKTGYSNIVGTTPCESANRASTCPSAGAWHPTSIRREPARQVSIDLSAFI